MPRLYGCDGALKEREPGVRRALPLKPLQRTAIRNLSLPYSQGVSAAAFLPAMRPYA